MFFKKNGNLLVRNLSLATLLATVIGCLNHFYYYEYMIPAVGDGEGYYRLCFNSLSEWTKEGWWILAITLLPSVLLVIYTWKFKGSLDAWILGGIFGVYALRFFVFELESLQTYLKFAAESGTTLDIVLEWALEIAAAVLCVLAVCSAARGYRNKLFAIFAMSAHLMLVAIDLNTVSASLDYYTENKLALDLVTYFVGTFGNVAAYSLVIVCVVGFGGLKRQVRQRRRRR